MLGPLPTFESISLQRWENSGAELVASLKLATNLRELELDESPPFFCCNLDALLVHVPRLEKLRCAIHYDSPHPTLRQFAISPSLKALHLTIVNQLMFEIEPMFIASGQLLELESLIVHHDANTHGSWKHIDLEACISLKHVDLRNIIRDDTQLALSVTVTDLTIKYAMRTNFEGRVEHPSRDLHGLGIPYRLPYLQHLSLDFHPHGRFHIRQILQSGDGTCVFSLKSLSICTTTMNIDCILSHTHLQSINHLGLHID
ncbi:hypothetical protein K470DRAFT_254550, partial [Piedraia hortae CBS 480.64]